MKGASMTDFNLHALIREVADSSTIADPATLAKEVSRRIDRKDLRTALEQALPHTVQQVVHLRRSPLVVPGGHAGTVTHGSRAAGEPKPSRKVQGIREAWRRMLRERLNVGPAVSDWKFLADCTVADLSYAASRREDHARRNAERAAQLRRLAELLEEHGVATVGELPDAELGDTLGAAA